MKRRVSFLLMLILAFALMFALSSCGECEHVKGDPIIEITSDGNCRTAVRYDEVYKCTECGEEMSRTAKKGEIGDHIPADAVIENADVLSCLDGGTADSVVYCSVSGCGAEISREKGITVDKANAHSLKTKAIYNEAHTSVQILEYCESCPYQLLRAPKSGEVSDAEKAEARKGHVYQPKTAGVCKYCFKVLSTSNTLEYKLNEDGESYTLIGPKKNATLGQQLFIGYYNDKPVTHIAPEAFMNNSNIQFVTIDKCVKEIGANAFAGCSIRKVYIYDLSAWCAIKFGNAAANPISVSSEAFSPNKIDISKNSVLTIPADVTAISDYAFAGIKAHTVYIPSNVNYVGANAFFGCSSLVNVHVQDGLRIFGEDTFANCDNIRNVYTDSLASWLKNSFASVDANPASNAEFFYAGTELVNGESGVLVIPEGVTVISSYAFANLGITSVTIPSSVVTVSDGAFAGCIRLSEVKIGENVSSIGASAFKNCAAITSITIPDKVTAIGNGAFENCAKLETITLGKGVNAIGNAAFKGCASLTAIELPAVLTALSEDIFAGCKSLKTVTFGSDLNKIGKNAFLGCTSITEFTFTSKIETIEDNAFSGCTALSAIALSDSLKTIGAGAFKNCNKITEIIVPAGVESIGLGAFEGCTSVEKMILPFIGNKLNATSNLHFGFIFGAEENWEKNENGENVKLLAPNNAAYVPHTLAEVEILSAVSIADSAFAGCEGITKLVLPENLAKIGEYAFDGCTGLTAVIFPDLDKWCAIEFANYSANPLANAHRLYIADSETPLTSLTITSGEILPYSFYGATDLVEIVIGEGVKKIGHDAFARCTSLSKVTLPSTLEIIGARAFIDCDNIDAVTISDVAKWCKVVFTDAFANPLYYAGKLFVGEDEVTELIISGTESIASYAFTDLDNITKITISDGVKVIGNYAFYNCDGITEISLPASVILVAEGAFENCSSLAKAELGSILGVGLRAFADCTALTSVVIPDTATIVSNEAFSGCTALTEVTLGKAVETIGTSAFLGCKALTKIAIPASVTSIGAHAFSSCDALASVTFGATEGWTVKGETIDSAVLADAAKALVKLIELTDSDWTRA